MVQQLSKVPQNPFRVNTFFGKLRENEGGGKDYINDTTTTASTITIIIATVRSLMFERKKKIPP